PTITEMSEEDAIFSSFITGTDEKPSIGTVELKTFNEASDFLKTSETAVIASPLSPTSTTRRKTVDNTLVKPPQSSSSSNSNYYRATTITTTTMTTACECSSRFPFSFDAFVDVLKGNSNNSSSSSSNSSNNGNSSNTNNRVLYSSKAVPSSF